MPKHFCIDPQDLYAEREILVDFVRTGSKFRLISAVNEDGDDILDDLIETQCRDLHLELRQANIPFRDLSRSARNLVAGPQSVSR